MKTIRISIDDNIEVSEILDEFIETDGCLCRLLTLIGIDKDGPTYSCPIFEHFARKKLNITLPILSYDSTLSEWHVEKGKGNKNKGENNNGRNI